MDGVGIPAGGTTGQALVKASDSDYDSEWVDIITDHEELTGLQGGALNEHYHLTENEHVRASALEEQAQDQQDPTGFVYPADVIVSYDPVNRTITLTGPTDYWNSGLKSSLGSPWVSPAHGTGPGLLSIYKPSRKRSLEFVFSWIYYCVCGFRVVWGYR
jgi:hypothetical protein